MKTRSAGSVMMLVALALATPAIAQAPSSHATAPTIDAKTPGDCTKGLNDWRAAQLAPAAATLRSAAPDTRPEAIRAYQGVYSAVQAEAVRAAKECGAKFSVDRTPSAQLIDLIGLYSFTGDTSNRRRATERVLAATDLPPRQHGQALALAMSEEISRAGNSFGIIDGAERVIARIDALPDSLADIKMNAHASLLGRYEYLDVNEGLRTHATALIDLGRRLRNQNAMINGYSSLARAAADRLQPDSALTILDNAERELGADKVGPRFVDFRQRYALIGTKAAPVTGEWWLNAPGTPAPVTPGDGRVRLVEFTATWCVPCKNSYPGLRALGERFRGTAFEGVMVTSLYGYLGDRHNLTPEQEVEADRGYFTQEHALPFRVAINPPVKGGGQPKVDEDYRVGGIPQIAIIDKRGMIRQIVTGWDQGNTRRIGDLIERLLKEPAA